MNEQEQLWSGHFGDEYHQRNRAASPANDVAFFKRALRDATLTEGAKVLELGAGSGHNLRALLRVLDRPYLAGVELNREAWDRLNNVADEATHSALADYTPSTTYDLVFTKGLLIHIHPDQLPAVYALIEHCAARYILLAEYFNPTPVGIEYRGQKDALWKRDFAGDMLDAYPALRVVDYGFVWRRDRYPQDDVTYFLLERTDGNLPG